MAAPVAVGAPASRVQRAASRWSAVATAATLACLVLPALLCRGGSTLGQWLAGTTASVLAATGVARLVATRSPATPAPLGAFLVAGAAWLLSQTAPGPVAVLVSVALGIGVGLRWTASLPNWRDTVALRATGALAAVLVGVRLFGPGVTLVVALVALAVSAFDRQPRLGVRPSRAGFALGSGAALFSAVLASWIGANSASATWFGSLASHGPRSEGQVAITIDGHRAADASALARELDAHGVKATFFTDADELAAHPAAFRNLLEDGQLLADNGYSHGATAWLNPRYPNLARAAGVRR